VSASRTAAPAGAGSTRCRDTRRPEPANNRRDPAPAADSELVPIFVVAILAVAACWVVCRFGR